MSNSVTYLEKTYTDEEIMSGNFERSVSLNMSELSVDTVSITLRPYLAYTFFTSEPYPFFTRERLRFEVDSGNTLVDSFTQNDVMTESLDENQIASWRLDGIERVSKDQYKVSGMSALGMLTQKTHNGGVYEENGGVTVADVVDEIMGDLPYELAADLQTVELHGHLPIASARDNLQQILFAIGANLRIDANGVMHIENIYNPDVKTIDDSIIYQANAYSKSSSPVTGILLVEHRYLQGNEAKKLYEKTDAGTEVVTFNEPVDPTSFTTTGTLQVSATNKNANYAEVSGIGTLSGVPYVHTTRDYEYAIPDVDQTVKNVVRVASATLVTPDESNNTVLRLADYYKCRKEVNVSVAGNIYNPGDMVTVFDPYDEQMLSACIAKESVSLSSTVKSTITALVGFTPWSNIPMETVRVVLDENNPTHTIPNGVIVGTGAKLVVFGAGNGGSRGADGADGDGTFTDPDVKAYPDYEKTLWWTGGNGYGSPEMLGGGDGGDGGAPGDGGKILQAVIGISPGMVFSTTPGQGGAGGTDSGEATDGGETIVSVGGETYSSADGYRKESGYKDYTVDPPVVFAASGTRGTDGGDGGKGHQKARGETGQSVSGESGGSGGRLGKYTYTPTTPDVEMFSSLGGAGGGGAAVGNNGGNANATWGVDIQPGTVGTPSLHFTFSDIAGNGANAIAPSATAAEIGSGGNGGHGGGGGGGAAGYSGRAKVNPQGAPEFWYTTDTKAGIGGKGSNGTNGARGGALLIYRKPITT